MKQSKRYRKAVSQIRWQEDPWNLRLSSLTSSLHLHCWLCWLYWPPVARPTSRYPGSAARRWLLRPDSRCPSWPSPWTSQWLVPSQSRLGGQTSQVLGFSIQVHLKMCKMCVAFLNYFRMYLECRGLKTTDILFIYFCQTYLWLSIPNSISIPAILNFSWSKIAVYFFFCPKLPNFSLPAPCSQIQSRALPLTCSFYFSF